MTTQLIQPAEYSSRTPHVSAKDWNAYIKDLVDSNITFTTTAMTVKNPTTFQNAVGIKTTILPNYEPYSTLQMGFGGYIASNIYGDVFIIQDNAYFETGTGTEKYINNGVANKIQMGSGGIIMKVAPSGIAGEATSFINGITLSSTTGDLRVYNNLVVDGGVIKNNGGNIMTFDGSQVTTFANFPLTPSSAPTIDYQVANKKYVDDSITGGTLNTAGNSGIGSIDLDTQSLSIVGTTDQVSTVAGSQTVTISLPQDIATDSEVEFYTLTVAEVTLTETEDTIVRFNNTDYSSYEIKNMPDEIRLRNTTGDYNIISHDHENDALVFGMSGGAVLSFDEDGIGTFAEFPLTPSSTPSANYEVANKLYVDTLVTAQDLDIAGDSGTGAVDLDSQSLTVAGGTNLVSVAGSQTVTVNLSVDEDIVMSNNGVTDLGYIDFDLTLDPAGQEGRLKWNPDDGTVDLGMPGGNVNIQLGQEQVLPNRPKNIEGSQIDNGDAVILSGATGSVPEVQLVNATEIDAFKTIAIATENVVNNQRGYYTTFGAVRDFDTSFGSDGADAYLDVTDGTMTATKPSFPNYCIPAGKIIRSHASEGIFFANIHAQRGDDLANAFKQMPLMDPLENLLMH